MRAVIGTALLMMCSTEVMASEGVIALDQHVKLGIQYLRTEFQFPEQLVQGSERHTQRNSFWLSLSGGSTSSSPDTDLGTQVGIDWALRLGGVENEAAQVREGAALAFDSRLALAMRTFAWNNPFLGSVVLIAGPEFSAGGGLWWSDSARLTFVTGVRVLSAAVAGDARFEMGYVIAPFVFTSSPRDLDVRRVEHRFALSGGSDWLGLGVYFNFVDQRVDGLHVGERGFGGSFDMRW